jgi:hypothetical protein
MWKSGIATKLTACSFMPHKSRALGRMPRKLSFVSMTPFGRPVVPLE